MPELKTLTRAQGANQALISHEVEPDGWTLSFADEPVLVKGFRKMVRNDEYDVAELAVTTYLTAKEHGAKFTALPIFIVRDFHHGKTQVLADGPVRTTADLAGKRVGVNRGYTVTAGVWARAALADAGLDLSSVTWVLSGDEHVATYVPPANVEAAPVDRTLEEMLLSGELDAVVNAGIENDTVVSLLPESAAWDSLKETGFVPVNHLVVVRDELLEGEPRPGDGDLRGLRRGQRQVRRATPGRARRDEAGPQLPEVHRGHRPGRPAALRGRGQPRRPGEAHGERDRAGDPDQAARARGRVRRRDPRA